MKKILIISPGYPSEKDKYNNGFVHSRVKEYKKHKIAVNVFSIEKKNYEYNYEGIKVEVGNKEKLKKHLKENAYDKILIHFGFKKTVETVIENTQNTPIIIWVHGVEALGWYRRLFNLRMNLKEVIKFAGYIILNTRQMLFMRRLILTQNKNRVSFVFVSEWMKNILEKDTLTRGKLKNYHIIPNVINTDIFKYEKKKSSDRYKIFNIRPYHSKKYANDITMDTIIGLSKKDYFDKLEIHLYGDGRLHKELTDKVKKFPNVFIHKGFYSQKQIAEFHKNSGILLMPTRQDAQGVSMCEAMSSGLVPVVSKNTAIPEFVNEDMGYLTKDCHEMVEAIDEMYNNPEKFKELSKNASKGIQLKCSPKVVIKKEIDIIG